jgi:hypothetical protein
MTKKLVFTGCSFTAGNGWEQANETKDSQAKTYPGLWVNLVHQNILSYNNLELVNYGSGGASNTETFETTVKCIGELAQNIDTIFCQWTSVPRYRFNVGLELWSTLESIHKGNRSKFDVNLTNGSTFSRKYLDDILDKMLVLHHPHTEILKIVSYCHTLKLLAQRFDIKLYFVNGLCPWDQDYFVRLLEFMPNDLTTFTKKDILEIDFRNDADIFSLYTIIHNEYDRAGGIDPINWVNLYSSMANNKIDTNFDKQHPGNKSNQLYFQIVKDFLNQKNIN